MTTTNARKLSIWDRPALACAAILMAAQGPAFAQLFSDDEARRAILDLRARLTQIEAKQTQIEARQTQTEARQAELAAMGARVDGLARAQLDNAATAEAMRRDIAQVRGAVEQLTQQLKLSEDQQRQLLQPIDAQLQSVYARLAALEPQPVMVDDQRVMVSAAEKSAFEAAQSLLASSALEAGAAAFSEFNTRFPGSALAPWALSAEGAAYYATKVYPMAIQALSRLARDHPGHSRTPDGLLTLAASQAESGQTTAARATLATIPKRFPGTEAARTATQRLKALPAAGSR